MRSTRTIWLAVSLTLLVGSCSSSGATRAHHPTRPHSAHPSAPAACPPTSGRSTPAQLRERRPAVDRMLGRNGALSGVVKSVGEGANAIEVDLLQGHETLAARLRRAFPNVVHVKIEGVEFCGGPSLSPKCPDLPVSAMLPAGLHLTFEPLQRTIHRGRQLGGSFVVRNDSPTPLLWDTGQPLIGVLVRPGTRSVVGHFTGPVAGTGFGINVHDGQRVAIPTTVGTARCDGGLGSTLPPGTYGARVGIGPNEGPPTVFAPEVRIRITK